MNSDPGAYGFSKGDLKKAGGAIWMDRLHPTSAMHKVVADDLDDFLGAYRTPGVETRKEGEPAKETVAEASNDVP